MINITRSNFSYYLYIFGIFLLAVSLPFSKFLMSISEIILLLSWLSAGNIFDKIKLFAKNKTALILSSVFILHLIGLMYTSDFHYGIEDVKKKIPLMLLPLIFSTSAPLAKNIFEKLLSFFVLSVVVASLICFYVLLGYADKQILQPQQASIFISHIRFSLLISMAVFILGYFFIQHKSFVVKVSFSLLIIWLILFLIMTESTTGLVCIVITSLVLLLSYAYKTQKMFFKISSFCFFILTCFLVFLTRN